MRCTERQWKKLRPSTQILHVLAGGNPCATRQYDARPACRPAVLGSQAPGKKLLRSALGKAEVLGKLESALIGPKTIPIGIYHGALEM
jgi:hypothetical protein